MDTTERNEALDNFKIGQLALIQKWLDHYGLPYKKENISRIPDEKGFTKAFEVLLDNSAMISEFKDENYTPEFLENGEIKITVTLNA